ncbi:MAG: acyl-ACP--UDP-N- acetylglucosamine O-acyltransferase [Eubacteriales bacterium]|nr:acyl-ACP--UDP-N- acetylglucosamine O-acyltransferase [Eubacteriales bacterium]
MKNYELIHEIFDMCNGKPDSQISEIAAENLDDYMKDHISRAATCEKSVDDNGAVVYLVMTNGQKERYTFSEI